VPAYGPQNDVTLKMPAFEWVHVQLHQQKGMISLSPPTICNSAFCADFNRHLQICPDAQLGLAEQLLLGVVDTAMMAQNALTAAESLGLGGVYIGGLRNNIEAVTELLKLPQHVLPLFGLCLGWPADNPDLKPRLPASILVHENSYQPLDKDALAQYDEQLAEYYLTRGSNNRRDTWSDHIRRTIIKESRPFILDYLHKQGWATR
ncbi:oxygen-insensitive NADPH nitroreductase, partial [Escherichia coli]|uniref:oxygen-insensitive NADPH nitroreductase n=1 Tax=Escherichia coli TaxID=562 RepID=UPI003C19C04D